MFINTAIALILRPKPEPRKDNSPNLEDLKFPEASEGKTIPLVVGRRHVKSPNVIWYEADRKEKVGQDNIYTSYFASMHLAISYSPIILFEILVDNKKIGIHEVISQEVLNGVPFASISGFTNTTRGSTDIILPYSENSTTIIPLLPGRARQPGLSISFSNWTRTPSARVGATVTKWEYSTDAITSPVLSITNEAGNSTGTPIPFRSRGGINEEAYLRGWDGNSAFSFILTRDELRSVDTRFGNYTLNIGKTKLGYAASLIATGKQKGVDADGNIISVYTDNALNYSAFVRKAAEAQSSVTNPSGIITKNTTLRIVKPDLMGGVEEGGGIEGTVSFLDGVSDMDSVSRSFLTQRLETTEVPDYLGIAHLLIKSCNVGSNSASIRPWSFDVGGYYNKLGVANNIALIGQDANPACFLYECLVNEVWGASVNPSDIDITSFITAANTLSSESLGSSFVWSSPDSISKIMTNVLNEIFGYWVVDHSRGSIIKLVLMRPFTGNENTLPVLKPINNPKVKGISAYGNINQVIITYKSHEVHEDKDKSITVNHSAAIAASQGVVKTKNVTLSTISSEVAATYIAKLHLLVGSSPLQSYDLILDAFDNNLTSGDFVFFSLPTSRTNIHRILNIDVQGRKARVKIIEDVFSSSYYGFEFGTESFATVYNKS